MKTKRFTASNFWKKGLLSSFINLDFWDNSIKDDSNWKNIDYIIFAGTPEWYGRRVKMLYTKILSLGIPCLYLGIGAGELGIDSRLTNDERSVLRKALLIVVRDIYAFQILNTYDPHLLPCPSLLCSGETKVIEEIKRIGLIYSSSRVTVNNNISQQTEIYMKALYQKLLLMGKSCELICHYVEELDYVGEDFPGIKYHYHYDPHGYLEIYKEFDLVIGCRVHGIGVAASLGIPGVVIAHSIRSDTVRHFGTAIIDPTVCSIDEACYIIDDVMSNIKNKSLKINRLKVDTREQYVALLQSVLRKVPEREAGFG